MDERAKAVISAAAVLVVNALALWGVGVDAGELTDALLTVAMLASTAWGVWKNHNFTRAAQQGQLVTNQLKNEQAARHARGE